MMGPAGRAHCAWGGRSHAFLTFLDTTIRIGPPVGREKMIPTNGRTNADRPCKTGIRATKGPPHAQWARQAGQAFYGVGAVMTPQAMRLPELPLGSVFMSSCFSWMT